MGDLSALELHVLQRAADGEFAKDTARALFRAESTVRAARLRACRKLGTESIEQAVAIALRRGLIS